MVSFRRYLHLVLLLVSSMVFPRFTCLVALFTLLFPLLRLTTTMFHLILYAFFNLFSTNQFTVKESFSFAEWAKSYNHNNESMCSFDVSSLFTNIPLNETIQICLDKSYALPNPLKLPWAVLKNLLFLRPRGAILCSMASSVIWLTELPWALF